MTDLEILTLIDRRIVEFVQGGASKFKREIDVLLRLKYTIEAEGEIRAEEQARHEQDKERLFMGN